MGDETIRHACQVYYTRRLRNFFRKRYWVECRHCGLKKGPYRDRRRAKLVSKTLWGIFGEGIWCQVVARQLMDRKVEELYEKALSAMRAYSGRYDNES